MDHALQDAGAGHDRFSVLLVPQAEIVQDIHRLHASCSAQLCNEILPSAAAYLLQAINIRRFQLPLQNRKQRCFAQPVVDEFDLLFAALAADIAKESESLFLDFGRGVLYIPAQKISR